VPAPNFLLIGAPKAATTAIAVMLAKHPDVCLVDGKEPHFFSVDQSYARGWDWYLSLYSHCRGERAIGDASTSYSRTGAFPQVVDRIVRHAPGVKIVYAVRHPLDRIESAYVEWMATPQNTILFPSVREAVRSNPNLLDSSRYWKQISAYRRYFPDERIKILWFEDYVRDPDAVLSGLFRFLGVADVKIDRSDVPVLTRESRVKLMRSMGRNIDIDTRWDRATRRWAIEQLGDDPRKFLEWAGKPADYWRIREEDATLP
jgi:hypothetical protein